MSTHDGGTYLVSLFIGPVQDFIGAALRTRDLWFGSHMLSEVSRASARAMREHGAELIFPVGKLLDSGTESNIANRIMALVSGDKARAMMVGDLAKKAACNELERFFTETKKKIVTKFEGKHGVSLVNDRIWEMQAQPDDLLELYFTGVEIIGNDYKSARERLDALTFARKNSRDFCQAKDNDPDAPLSGRPKSSLDGCRETVLRKIEDKVRNKFIRRKLRMGDNEQLDAMGLVKRLAGENPDQFTPTTRIAADPWIRTVAADESGRETLKKIAAEFEKLADLESDCITGVNGNQGIYEVLPYDCGLLYPGPLGSAIRDSEDDREKATLQHLRTILKPVWQRRSRPCPYYTMLLADGDRMGELLKKAGAAELHQQISAALAGFAEKVPAKTREYYGHCIYAGGDDVLLMAPLDTALELADALRKTFSKALKEVAEKLGEAAPTFSVGLVMAHMQTPLGRVRRLAAKAEQLAKGTDSAQSRNGLAILVDPRSGAETRVRLRWDSDFLDHFNNLVRAYKKNLLPTGFPHELRRIILELPESAGADLEKIRRLELERVLNRKNVSGGRKEIDANTVELVLNHADTRPLAEVAREHLAACWLSGHTGGNNHG